MKPRSALLLAAAPAIAGVVLASLSPALAQTRKQPGKEAGTFQIGTFGDWGAYVSGKDRSKICYAMSQPKERSPKGLTRDPAYIFISSRAGDGAKHEFAVIMGYPLKPGASASATIGPASFVMLTKDKSAWLRNAAEENQMLDALRKGTAMVVKGTSAKGNDTIDRYSLSGAGQAIERMQRECP